jgi:hypothetical protein
MTIPSKRFEIIGEELTVPTVNFYEVDSNSVYNFASGGSDTSVIDSMVNTIVNVGSDVVDTLVDAPIDTSLYGLMTDVASGLGGLFTGIEDVISRSTKDLYSSTLGSVVNNTTIGLLNKQAFNANSINTVLINSLVNNTNITVVPVSTKVPTSTYGKDTTTFAALINEVSKDNTAIPTLDNNKVVNPTSSDLAIQAMATTYTVNGYKNNVYGLFDKLVADISDKNMLVCNANDILMYCVTNDLVYGVIDICNSLLGNRIRAYNSNALSLVLKSFKIPSSLGATDYTSFLTTYVQSIVKLQPGWTLANNTYPLSNDLLKLIRIVKLKTSVTGAVSDESFNSVAQAFR